MNLAAYLAQRRVEVEASIEGLLPPANGPGATVARAMRYAVQAGVDAPIADHTKNDAGETREVWNSELLTWIEWRLQQATPERRLRGEVALFWNPTARNRAKRWTPDPMGREWARACKKAGVAVPLQEGTRHATLTQLGGALTETVLKAFSRHKDSRSLQRYSKPRAKKAAIVRAIRGEE